jgi:DNA-binding NtrC family response regulator
MGKAIGAAIVATVLVVEDDEATRFGVCGSLRTSGFRVIEAESCAGAVAAFRERPDVVVTDLRLPDGDALCFLPQLRAAAVPVLIVTGYGTIDLAVRAVKEGAEDFLTKPVDVKVLATCIHAAVDKRRRKTAGAPRTHTAFVSRSRVMRRLAEEIERLRDADCSVLLLGETGTGKSVLARHIHDVGARKRGAFVDINCAGLTREFVETELFGHERGAFTGAHAANQGLLDAANGGTLFLDEIGDLDAQVQPKLLKVLEEKRFRRMGDVRERSVDVRLIGATHHDLVAAAGEKRFRADLYYRISTVTITVPPLRERAEDIVPLAYHLLADLEAEDVRLGADAEDALLSHAWPGNLRELKNVLERGLLLNTGSVLRAGDLRFDAPSTRAIRAAGPRSDSARTLSEVEREHIQLALRAEQGRVEAAARRLGIPRSTMYQRIKDYGISPSKERVAARDEPPESR